MFLAYDSGSTDFDWESYKKKWFEVSVIHLVDILMAYNKDDDGGYSNSSSRASSFMSLNSSPYYMRQREKSGSCE